MKRAWLAVADLEQQIADHPNASELEKLFGREGVVTARELAALHDDWRKNNEGKPR